MQYPTYQSEYFLVQLALSVLKGLGLLAQAFDRIWDFIG